jgi:hypothetical protein
VTNPKVLLVAGAAHGGTTITGLVLGQHPQVIVTGKLRGFPHGSLFDPENFCTCGQSAMQCPFWTEVRRRFHPFQDEPAEEQKSVALYRIISQVSGRPFVGDVTHKAHDVERLMQNPGIDLRLVHVVRELEAVVFSRLRKDHQIGRLEALGWSRLGRTAKVAFRWQRQRGLFARAERALGRKAVRIGYEELCAEPTQVLERVGSLLDLDMAAVSGRLREGLALEQPPHMIRGNAKLKAQEQIHLRSDTAYRRDMPSLERLLCRVSSRIANF